jgi:2-polyprenyl-6-hydroxyphenyl methylase/3-demethylubiquinone-9 3-methyltransferase
LPSWEWISHDRSKSAEYFRADALALPWGDHSFDAACMMDFLEHVETPEAAIHEAARILKPGGLLFFHTFNRNWLSWLVVIRGVEWFVKNTPSRMHVLRLFVKPAELKDMLRKNDLEVVEVFGSSPRVFSKAFWSMLWRREVPDDFEFRRSRSLLLGYTGCAWKKSHFDRQGSCAELGGRR